MLDLYFIFIIQTFGTIQDHQNLASFKYKCRELYINLDDTVNFRCISNINSSNAYYEYDDFLNYNFQVGSALMLYNISFQNDTDYIKKFSDSIYITNKTLNITFYNFFNLTAVNLFFYNKSASSTLLYYNWTEYAQNITLCPWDNGTFYQQYLIGLENSNWKKVCLSKIGYLYHYDKPHGKLIIVPKVSAIIIIISTIVGIIGLMIALYFISFCRLRDKCDFYELSDSLSSY